MFGILGDIAEGIGKIAGTVVAVPIAAVAVSLGVSSVLVSAAVDAGCETVEEIKEFIDNL